MGKMQEMKLLIEALQEIRQLAYRTETDEREKVYEVATRALTELANRLIECDASQFGMTFAEARERAIEVAKGCHAVKTNRGETQ